jgi:bifunctional non-homologous end joining protein LigD
LRRAETRRVQAPPPGNGVPPYNILQRLPEGVAPSDAELAAYWATVEDQALEHLGRRPLKLVRRVGHTIFYHKGPLPPVPGTVHRLKVQKREGGEGVRLWVDDLAGLIGLVKIGAVELHPWNATIDDIEHADRLIIDLDPGEGIEWAFVQETALRLRELFESEGLRTWPKVTGGKGLHVMAPLKHRITHDEAHAYSKALVERIAGRAPRRYTTSAAMAQRPGRLFLDYLRNGRGTTAVGAWSPRVHPGFPIARPVTWRQVEARIRPDAFTMDHPFKAGWPRSATARLARR